MNVNVRDLLFILLRFAIKGEAVDKTILNSLSDEKLATLFKVAKQHDMAHLVAYALKESGFFSSSDIWQKLLYEIEQAKLRYEMIQADINEICACFENEKISFIPLKGAVIREYYPEPWMRTSCDIDILINEKDVDKATTALTTRLLYKTDYKKTGHEISFYSPFGMHLELHYKISCDIDKYDSLLLKAWDYAFPTCQGKCYNVFDNEFALTYHITHIAYHFIWGGCGLRPILDLYIMRLKLTFDYEDLKKLLNECGLLKLYEELSLLGDYWMGHSKIASEILKKMERFVLLGGSYGTVGTRVTMMQAKKGGKFKYFLSRVFMPYKKLIMLYPVTKKHKILVPFCQIARWIGVIFKSKRITNEIKTASSISEERMNEALQVLNYFEL